MTKKKNLGTKDIVVNFRIYKINLNIHIDYKKKKKTIHHYVTLLGFWAMLDNCIVICHLRWERVY
jgi:hypothetical protein